MTEKRNRSLDLPKEAKQGVFKEFIDNLKLIVRLLKDRRVSFWLKLLPVGALIYLVFPMDIFPILPLDDAFVVWLGGYLFIELCPQDIVREHKQEIRQTLFEEEEIDEPGEVIYGEFNRIDASDKDEAI